MKHFKKVKRVICFLAFACCVAEYALIAGLFEKTDLSFDSRLLSSHFVVLIVGIITLVAADAVIKVFSRRTAFELSGLVKNQSIAIIDYAHNRVLRYVVDAAHIEDNQIIVAAHNLWDREKTIKVNVNDIFRDLTDAKNANARFIRSQLDAVEKHFGIVLNEEGEAYFIKQFGTLYPDCFVFPHEYEWDIDWYEESMSEKLNSKNVCGEHLLSKGYVQT